MTAACRRTALVLAGSRRREADPVARCRGVPHKCLAPAGGVPLLERVLTALAASPHIGTVLVALDEPALRADLPTAQALEAEGRLRALQAAPGLGRSVLDALALAPTPLLVTTADHPLLTPAMLDAFLTQAETTGADIVAGFVAKRRVEACYPSTRRTWLVFRDGAWSGANLFALQSETARAGIAFWQAVEGERKRPWRLARRLGPAFLLAYACRLLTLDQALARAGRRLGIRLAAAKLPMAEAAIDVDKPEDLDLVERILAARTPASV
ncbi:NTP transferase domain-containing protein [Benzoatithermus flavus]|uniref:Nucleotidyltransferase family protein n=1 Tax=Benzoatithermus flavus TaxID=3108223 RepID=A0ABU8XUL7_9PROT